MRVFLVCISLLLTRGDLLAQAASGTWPLSQATTQVPTVSGDVTAANEAFSALVINNYSGPNSSQRVTTTDGQWPAETAQNDGRYIQFALSPSSGHNLTVTSVSMNLGAAGGSNMRANIWYSTDPTFASGTQLNGAALVLPSGGFIAPPPSYTIDVEVTEGQTLYVRIYPWYTTASTGKYICPQNVVIAGTTSLHTSSIITTSVSSLPGFGPVIAGTVSGTLTYEVSGTGLAGDIAVNAPSPFEISLDSAAFSGSLTLVQSSGTVPPTTIYARFAPSTATGTATGVIAHTSTNAEQKDVSVTGIAIATEPSTGPSVTISNITISSFTLDFTGGDGQARVAVLRAGAPVSWSPVDGVPVTGVNANFAAATDQGNGNKAVYDGTGSSVTVTGFDGGTTYHVAVYEYNSGTGNAQNYNTTSPGTGNATTLPTSNISLDPTNLSFGPVPVNTTSPEQSYSVSGSLLSPGDGMISIAAPTAYEISTTSGSGFGSSIDLPYTGGTLAPTTIYVHFTPTAVTTYNGSVTHTGGGSPTRSLAVSGSGMVPSEPNVFEAENGILASSYTKSEYPGFTGTGYVDLADKVNSSVEVVFSRASAASDTVTVRYANGATSRSLAITVNDVASGTLNFPATGSWSTWSTARVVLSLNAGLNRLRFTSTTNNTNANLDRIIIGGQTATPVYKLTIAASGTGSVSADSAATYYVEGSQVTLTAVPTGTNVFVRWSGTDESAQNPFVMTMNSHKTEIGIMMDPPGGGTFPYEVAPKGFASVGALGYPNGTTGGSGPVAYKVYVTNAADLQEVMLRRVDASHTLNFPPLTVFVVGTLTRDAGISEMVDVKDLYDVSIIGVGGDATLRGFGLSIVRSSNVIVRNILFADCPDDGIGIQADDDETKGHHIWIDHCSFTDSPDIDPGAARHDGELDISHTASYVTVSWCRFMNHSKTCLLGHSDGNTQDVAMKITYHHNWFDGTIQRHPRVRYATAHIYNNYYANNSLYGVSSNLEADVVVEGCYFLNVPIPTETSRDGSPPGDLVERNNVFVNSGPAGTRGTAFDPNTYYTYTIEPAADIPQRVSDFGGSGRFDFSSNDIPLPIQLSVFTGTPLNDHSVRLDWTTLSEINNFGFHVQRRFDPGSTFADVPGGFVPGSGTTNIPHDYQYVDTTAHSGQVQYRLRQVDLDDSVYFTEHIEVSVPTGVGEHAAPTTFALLQNYPNPFNPATEIRFSVAATAHTVLEVFNILGQHVTTLFDNIAAPGEFYSVTFDARNLVSGTYFYRLQSGQNITYRKLLILK